MANRIEEGYREKLRALLRQLSFFRSRGGASLERAVDLLLGRARRLHRQDATDFPRALERVYQGVWRAAAKRLEARHRETSPPRFVCDAHLGGLARWLRAAGYQAAWTQGIEDRDLIEDALRRKAVLLTGDLGIMRRRIVCDGTCAAIWIPSCLKPQEQLAIVLRELGLGLREPRCMVCGGDLTAIEKSAVADRIPPRTARWKDEYQVCLACGKLFWRGTHWERIAVRLHEVAVSIRD